MTTLNHHPKSSSHSLFLTSTLSYVISGLSSLTTVKVRRSGALINTYPELHFKIATRINKHHDEHCQAAIVRAPEVTLGYPWSTSVDIWSVGCLVSSTQRSRQHCS